MVDFSFGSLGQGLAVGLGMVLGLASSNEHVWVILGDGECQEGMVWEAAMLAARYRVESLHVIVDANGEQECGWGHDPSMDSNPMPSDLAKWRAFGWHADEINGHDVDAISGWIRECVQRKTNVPSVLIARTHKKLSESVPLQHFRRHHTTLTKEEFDAMTTELIGSFEETSAEGANTAGTKYGDEPTHR